jgi:bifunctional non-homologous end joining protein LigD
MGVIELHAWGSTTRHIERPDRMVLDLDPDPRLPWREVMAAARHVRERLEDLGLESFVKTTGGKGLHVVVPLATRHDWDEVKQFSRAVAESIAADRPQDFTAKAAKRERTRRIYIDWLRNAEGATAIAPYSVRALPGAPVATPLHWDEVGGRMKPGKYHAGNVAKRLRGLHSDPWKQLRRMPQALTASMKRKLDIKP